MSCLVFLPWYPGPIVLQYHFASLRMMVLILTWYAAVFWDSLFKYEKLFEVPGHATEVRTVISSLLHHFSVACSISECWKWHWKESICSARKEGSGSQFWMRKRERLFEGKREHMGEGKGECESESTDSSAGKKPFSNPCFQSLLWLRWLSSLASLGASTAEAIGSFQVPNNVHKRSFEDAVFFPQRVQFQKEKRFGRKLWANPICNLILIYLLK